MHRLSTSFVLGYHGCDEEVAERLLAGRAFVPSENDYDWLGHGIYFWEANPKRGLEFAYEASRRAGSRIRCPAVVGAIIDLGLCLDLTSSQGVHQVGRAYQFLSNTTNLNGDPLPQNSPDLLRRNLDCAVINFLHDTLKDDGAAPFDTVKGIFTEGAPLYPGSGFHAKTHVQVCVRTTACVRGVFRVPAWELA